MTTKLTARSPEDLLAMVPVVLGFHPAESVVMLTFGGERAFHARVDLPPSEAEVDETVAALLDPSMKNGITRVIFVSYGTAIPHSVLARLGQAFTDQGINVLELVHTDGSRWWAGLAPMGLAGPGTAYDLSGHPFLLEAQFEDRRVETDRDALMARLEPVDAVFSGSLAKVNEDDLTLAAGMFVVRTELDGAETAVFVSALIQDRDVVLARWDQREVAEQTEWLIEVARRTPEVHRSVVLIVASMGAWLSGHGALSWCCLDAAPDPEACSLGLSMQFALTEAVPPSTWWEAQA